MTTETEFLPKYLVVDIFYVYCSVCCVDGSEENRKHLCLCNSAY